MVLVSFLLNNDPIMVYKAAPDMETANIPENEISIGNILQLEGSV